MKYPLKRALALLIALLLALPTFAFADETANENVEIEIADEDWLIMSDEIELPVAEVGEILLGDVETDDPDEAAEALTVDIEDLMADDPDEPASDEPVVIEDLMADDPDEPASDEPVVIEEATAEPFHQTVTIDGVTIDVTANTGAFPAGSVLRVTKVDDADIAQAVEAIIGAEGVYTHRQYRVEVLDGESNVILPDFEQGAPVVRVEGLNLPADARVAVYDEYLFGAYELDATVDADENAIEFDLVDITVYDIVTVEPLPEQEKQPAEDETEEPAEQPAEGQTEEPAEQPTEDETEEPAEQPAEAETEEPAEQPAEGQTEEPAEQPAEGQTEEPAEQPTEGQTEEPAEQPAEAETEEPAEEPAEGQTEEPAEQPAEDETEEPAEEPAEGQTEEPAEEPAEEPIEAPVVEQIDETVEEAEFSIEETVEEVVEIPEAALTDVLPETIVETPGMADGGTTTFVNITQTIYPKDKGTVTCTEESGTATLTITPDEHYKVDKVKVWVDNAVTEPEKKAENTYTFPYSEGSTVAVRVDFAVDGESYGLWVNGVEVSQFNASNVLGDGTVSYDNTTYTLTLNDANITKPYITPNGTSLGGIYANGDLIIDVQSDSSVNVQDIQFGIYATGALTIQGSGKLDVHGQCAINSGNGINIKNASVTATSGRLNYAITTGPADITIENANVTATCTDRYAIHTQGQLTIKDSTVNATGGAFGMYSMGATTIEGVKSVVTAKSTIEGGGNIISQTRISIGEGLAIAEPEKAKFGKSFYQNPDMNTILDADGKEPQKVVICKAGSVLRTVTVETGIENGTVTVDKETAYPGDTVTITYTPNEHYVTSAKGVVDTSGDSVDFVDNKDGTCTFTMPDSNVTVIGQFMAEWPWLQLLMRGGVDITLDRDYTDSNNDGELVIPEGTSVTLDLNGHKIDRSKNGRVITVKGELVVKDSSSGTGQITGGQADAGAGIYVDGGTLFLSSGAITGNDATNNGGGVYVTSDGNVVIGGGSVTGNTAANGGGVCLDGGGVCLDGGSIAENSAKNGGGVAVSGGTFMMIGSEGSPTIAKNTATENGGGVYLHDGTLYLSAGEISGNKASQNGGGVYVTSDGIFDFSGGTIGSGNEASKGGGVAVQGGTFNMCGYDKYAVDTDRVCRIELNKASQNGGGVALTGGVFNLSNYGAIIANMAENPGGGVYVNDGSFNLTGEVVFGAIVSGNIATSDKKDSNVYLPDGKTISVKTALNNATPIGVSMEKPGTFTDGYRANMDGKDPADYFTGDDKTYSIGLDNDGEALLGVAYTVTTESDSDKITLTADKAKAITGETVTLTVKENDSLNTVLKALTVTYTKDGESNTLTPKESESVEGEYTFVMPAADVTVKAESAQLRKVTVETTTHGKAAANRDFAIAGDAVTVTIEADEGYALTSLTVEGLDAVDHKADVTDGKYTFNMPDSGVTVKAEFLTPWMELQKQIDAAPNGGTVTLAGDTKAIQDDSPLHILEDRSVILDLAGHTLDANNHSFAISVLYESSALTLKDSSSAKTGKVTGTSAEALYVESGSITLEGGSISGNKGRGVHVNGVNGGSFTMNGGEISGNDVYGVYMENNGSFTMTGGTITKNGGEDGGGGVYMDGAINLSGSVSITGNTTVGGYARNVIVPAGNTITIAGALNDGASVGVTMQQEHGVFTTGFKAKMGENANPADFFTSDITDYSVRLSTDGSEACLMQKKTIVPTVSDRLDTMTVMVNGEVATATDGKYKAFPGDDISVTATAKDGYVFDGITVKDGSNAEVPTEGNTFTMPDGDVGVFDTCITEWKALQKAVEKGGDIKVSDIAGADKTIKDVNNEGRLEVKSSVVLDLDGCTIDRARTSAEGNGGVFYVSSGTLEVKDSKSGGQITGGWTTNLGGGVLVEGGSSSFTLSGGSIRGNKATNGGGVYVGDSSTFNMTGGAIENNGADTAGGVNLNKARFTMTGGAITGNTAKLDCGGVSVPVNSQFRLSGTVDISGNTDRNGDSNVLLVYGRQYENSSIYITGALTTVKPIGVRYTRSNQAPEPLVFTDKLPGNGTEANFASDDPHYLVGATEDGEACLQKAVVVTFDANGGSEVKAQSILSGEKATEPTAPTRTGYVLRSWHLLTDGTPKETAFDFDTPITEDITLQAKWVTVWQDLQDQIDAAPDGVATTITLPQDVTALPTEAALTVPAGKNVTIDLAGYKIDRFRSKTEDDGYVIRVAGTLEIKGKGDITGGWTNGKGGGVYVDGTGSFTLSGGVLRDNKADSQDHEPCGGGVYVAESGAFVLDGGTIRDNLASTNKSMTSAYGGGVCVDGGTFELKSGTIEHNTVDSNQQVSYGGGVYVGNGGAFTMTKGTVKDNESRKYGGGVYVEKGTLTLGGGSIAMNHSLDEGGGVYVGKDGALTLSGGSLSVRTNKTGNDGKADDVFLYMGKTMAVTGALSAGTRVGVGMMDPGVFTSGLKGKGTAENFFSDNTEYLVGITPEDEGILGKPVTVTFNTVGGSAVEAQTVATGSVAAEPEAAPTKDGHVFRTWHKVADGTPAEEAFDFENEVITGDTTIQAKYITLWQELQERINAAGNGDIIKLDQDITALPNEEWMDVPQSKNIVIDLAGHKIDRARVNVEANGSVFYVEGTLEVKDSANSADSAITGGWTEGNGGGVLVEGMGSFTLSGGAIRGNKAIMEGGGVLVNESGSFTMSGGAKIENNSAGNGGGVYLRNGATFDMNGGEILTNSARNGGGVYSEGYPTLSGGKIKNNSANVGGGVYVANETFFMKAGEISGNHAVQSDDETTRDGFGGGVHVYSLGAFNLSGGKITGNTAATHGGGVFVGDGTYKDYENSASFTMTGGEISGNTAQYNGGGVTNESLSVFKLSGGEISGNTAKYGSGVDNYSAFNMSGGRITGNKVTGDDKPIGGVRNGTTNKFTMTGGEISGNEGYGLGGPYEFTLSGKIEIRNNKLGNVILNIRNKPETDYVHVAGKLENQTPIGIFMDITGDFDAAVFTKGLKGKGTDENFASEQEGYDVVLLTTGEAMLARAVKITFDKNAASATGNMPAQNMAPGYESPLRANAFTRRGYTFAGWNTQADGKGKAYADKAALTPDGATTLYAQWTAHDFTAAAIAAQTYTGKALTPAPVVKDKTTGKTLKSGTDYTVAYKDNVNVGTATATITGKGDYADAKAVSVTFKINKAAPTVTAPKGKSLTYNGKAQALVAAGKVTGGTMRYSLDNKTWSKAVPKGTDAGTYTVYYRVTGDANHTSVAAKSVKATIKKAAPTVTAPTAKTLTYNGKAQALVTAGKVTGGTMRYSLDNKTWSKTIPTGKKAGSYTVYYKAVGDANHTGTAAKTVKVTIAKKAVTITGLAAKNKVYNGNVKATVTGTAKIVGLVSGDKVSVKAGKASFSDRNAGTGKAVKFTGYSLTGADAGNYRLKAQPAAVKANITRKGVTITGLSVKDKAYDGTTTATVTGTPKIVGLIAGDKVSVKKGVANFDGKDVGTHTVIFSGWGLTGADAKNYRLTAQPVMSNGIAANAMLPNDTQPAAGNARITPRKVRIVVPVLEKDYDGTADAAIGEPVIEGLVPGDDVRVVMGKATCDGTGAGTHTVTFTGWSLEGEDAGNYQLDGQPSETQVVIAAKAITITAHDAEKQQGQKDPKLTYDVEGLVQGDKLTGSLAREKGEQPGTYAITQGTLSAGGNYAVTFVGATLTITARPVGGLLLATLTACGSDRLTLKWTAVAGAEGYDVFTGHCDGGTLRLKASMKAGKARRLRLESLKKNTAYKARVRAWVRVNGKKTYVATSPIVHAFTNNRGSHNHTNAASVRVSKATYRLKKGGTATISAKVKGVVSGAKVLEHGRKLRYITGDRTVATVTSNGKIRAVGAGSCVIYVLASNGVRAEVKVTVK